MEGNQYGKLFFALLLGEGNSTTTTFGGVISILFLFVITSALQ